MSYLARRGDYGAGLSSYQLIEVVERVSCIHGCARAGTDAQIAEFGPGGACDLLARMCAPETVEEFDARPDGIHCSARIPRTTGERTATP